jgi:hypothetical protein
MTETRRFVFVVLGIVAALAMLVSPVAARATVTEFTATQELLYDIPGAMSFPNGNIHTHGGGHVMYMTASDPRMTGTVTIIGNGNFNAYFSGPMRLNFDTDPDIGGGSWHGIATGYIHADGSITCRATGHGSGDFDGLKVQFTVYNPVWPPSPANPSVIMGRILDPHGG